MNKEQLIRLKYKKNSNMTAVQTNNDKVIQLVPNSAFDVMYSHIQKNAKVFTGYNGTILYR
ncbi:hypothetical protein [Staphylococcus argenteus]|uniref:hypothetical protein n=1 Tax=Staphylococcus argenteus TaxID=985002 RepID=UPI00344E9FEF